MRQGVTPARSVHEVPVQVEAFSPWKAPADAGVLVVRVHDAGPVEGLCVGAVPGITVEAHRRDAEACTYVVIRLARA